MSIKSLRYPVRIGFVLLVALTMTFAAKPSVSVITSAITPRIYMWSAEENTTWLTLVNYSQAMGSAFQLNSSFEIGSVDEYLRNPLRVYLFSAKLKLKNNDLSLGRLSYWSGLVNMRFDGFKWAYKNKLLGNITVASGFDAVYDFSDTTWMDYPVVLLSWSKGSRNKKMGLTYWQEYFDKNIHTFTGIQWARKLFGFRYVQQFAYDLTANRIQSYRTHIAKNFGKHYTSLGLRQRRFMVKEVFPWIDESVQMPVTLYVSVKSIYSKTLMIWSQFSYRPGDNGTTYAHSTLLFRDVSLTALYGGFNGSTLLGGQIGYRKTLTSSLKCGIKLEFNALDMADDIIEPVKSKGSYGWLGWSPKESISVRLFYRYASNKYYTVDGRGGMTIHVAL